MNYRHVYMLIIEHAKSEMKNGLRPRTPYFKKNFPEKCFEFHHILPRSLFPNWAKRNTNIVALTCREHYFCHQLLTKIFPSIEMNLAMWGMMKGKSTYAKSSKEYEKIRKLYIEYLSKHRKGHEVSSITRLKISKALTGKKRSDEQNCRNSEALKAYYKSDKAKNRRSGRLGTHWSEHERQLHSNKKWYTDGEKNLLIDDSNYVPDGFYPGRVANNFGTHTKGKVMCVETKEVFNCAADTGIHNVYMVLRGERNTAGGFHWVLLN